MLVAYYGLVESTGNKNPSGKVPVHLLPVPGLLAGARAFAYGNRKYEADSWRKGQPASVYYAALVRHLTAWWDGEDLDKESGLHHLDHVVCNSLILCTLEEERPGKWVDDRPCKPPDPNRALLADLLGMAASWQDDPDMSRDALLMQVQAIEDRLRHALTPPSLSTIRPSPTPAAPPLRVYMGEIKPEPAENVNTILTRYRVGDDLGEEQ